MTSITNIQVIRSTLHLREPSLKFLKKGYYFGGQIGGEDLGDENSKVYNDMYESKSYAVILKIRLIGEIE